MAIANQKRTNVIYAGGKPSEYLIRGEAPAAIAFLPGTIVSLGGGTYSPLADSSLGLMAEVADKAYLSVGHVDDEYATGDLVVTLIPTPADIFNVRAAAGTYTKGQAVSVTNGVVGVSQSRDGNFGFVWETATVSEGELLRVLKA